MIFLFPRWDMLIPWRIYYLSLNWWVYSISAINGAVSAPKDFIGGATIALICLVQTLAHAAIATTKVIQGAKGIGLPFFWDGTWKKAPFGKGDALLTTIIFRFYVKTLGVHPPWNAWIASATYGIRQKAKGSRHWRSGMKIQMQPFRA